eukprot:464958-Hanusia_phi.AAC.1
MAHIVKKKGPNSGAATHTVTKCDRTLRSETVGSDDRDPVTLIPSGPDSAVTHSAACPAAGRGPQIPGRP